MLNIVSVEFTTLMLCIDQRKTKIILNSFVGCIAYQAVKMI